MKQAPYATDLTDAQWAVIEAAMPASKGGGSPADYPRREMWNAIFYKLKNGGTWRALPHDFPPWSAVWQQYRRWRNNGTLAAVHQALRAQVRRQAGKAPTPSAAVMDSQSVRVAEKRGDAGASIRARRSRGESAT